MTYDTQCTNPDCIRATSEHRGRSEAKWEYQDKFNIHMESLIHAVMNRMTALEKKVIFFSGVAAALGSGIGAAIANYILQKP